MIGELTIPGVYRVPAARKATFPRLRSDVCGFVGFAGSRRQHELVRLDDWRDFVEAFLRAADGTIDAPPSGSRLPAAIRAYFANGGARCYVVNVGEVPAAPAAARPAFADLLGFHRTPPATTGPAPGTPVRRTGLELLLEEGDEVSYFTLPDLFAQCPDPPLPPPEPLPPLIDDSRFRRCPDRVVEAGEVPHVASEPCPLFDDDDILFAQRHVIDRLARQPWRAFAILAVPPGRDAAGAAAWRAQLGRAHWAGLYWPWLGVQQRPGLPIIEVSPEGFAAGIFARRDRISGPHVSPANEALRDAVAVAALAKTIDDRTHAEIYDRGVNVLRGFEGGGIELWGARTLLWDDTSQPDSDAMAYVGNRRCLTAIQRSVERLGQRLVFEPNQALLRLQLSMAIMGYLLEVFHSGALDGSVPEEAFRVRCDGDLNTAQSIADGKLVCEVGVALTAPAEFLVFRVGRHEGVVEIEEL